MKKFVILLVIFIITSPVLGNNWKNIVSTKGKSVCIIQVMRGDQILGSGTGFLYNSTGSIITNAHVVKEAYYNKDNKLVVKFLYSKKPDQLFNPVIIDFIEDLDLAILKIKGAPRSHISLGSSKSLGVMDEIIVMGYPLGINFKATPGYIQSFQTIPELGKMLDINVRLDPGNSGGPILNSHGRVIGLATAKYIGYNFNFAIPIDIITHYLRYKSVFKPITITTNTPDGRVYINNIYKGLTPVTTKVYRKKNLIRIEKDGFITQEKKITINPTRKKTVKIHLKEVPDTSRTVIISTTPTGADVNIDNDYKGKTPVTIKLDNASTINISIKKFGYKRIFKQVSIKKAGKTTLTYKLKPGF